ncbi:MAG: copper chaperone PCu(A)C [Methylovirgula sp.]
MHASRSGFASLALLGGLALSATATLPCAAADTKGIAITDAWIRATPPGATVGGGFLEIDNKGNAPDRLIGGAAPATADKVELHESIMQGDVAEMRELTQGVPVAPGGKVIFEPGGKHLMFLGLKGRLTEGQNVKVQLSFEKAGKIDVDFIVRGIGAGAPQGGHHHH